MLDIVWPWASEPYGFCRLRAYFCAHKFICARSYGLIVLTDRCFKHATKSIVALDIAWPWANDTYGFCCLRTYLCTPKFFMCKIIRCYSPNRDSYGVLTANDRCWCWCCGPGCWCCELAARSFKTGGAGRVLVPLPVLSIGRAHRRWCQLIVRAVGRRMLILQIACILVPANRLSIGHGILPSYLGLCSYNLYFQLCFFWY